MEVEWRIREWQMRNGVCEKVKFPVILDGSVREGTRKHVRSIRAAEKNALDAAREFARLVNNNFEADGDCYLTQDYSQKALEKLVRRLGIPESDIEAFLHSVLIEHDEENMLALYLSAEREMANYTKRLRRACKKAGIELRYAYVTSDMDGKSFKPERIHHHLIVNREAAEIAAQCWTAGGSKPRTLWSDSQGDLSELAEYMIRQVRLIPGRHRYHPSRTLEKPEPLPSYPARNPDAPLRVPDGCKLIWRSESYSGRAQTIRYYRPPEKRRRIKRKKQEVQRK